MAEGVTQFIQECWDDELARFSCDLMILTYSGNLTVVQQFINISELVKNGKAPVYNFEPAGYTATGEAVIQCLKMLEERKHSYSDGTEHYQPWLVIMSDGRPEGPDMTARENAMKNAEAQIRSQVAAKKLTVFSVGMGNTTKAKASMDRLSPGRPSVHLQGLKFKEFFQWLSGSVGSCSRSTPGQGFKVAPITDWAQSWETLENAIQNGNPSSWGSFQ